jgi:Mor family transcriptional regulator
MQRADLSLIDELVDVCTDVVGRNTAIKGIRILCRYFGGTMLYIPLKKKDGVAAKRISSLLGEYLDEHDTAKIMDKIMTIFGSFQFYIPMERYAFQNAIAEEIYERYNDGVSVREMCREYCMSFTMIYQLWRKGRKIKLDRGKI